MAFAIEYAFKDYIDENKKLPPTLNTPWLESDMVTTRQILTQLAIGQFSIMRGDRVIILFARCSQTYGIQITLPEKKVKEKRPAKAQTQDDHLTISHIEPSFRHCGRIYTTLTGGVLSLSVRQKEGANTKITEFEVLILGRKPNDRANALCSRFIRQEMGGLSCCDSKRVEIKPYSRNPQPLFQS